VGLKVNSSAIAPGMEYFPGLAHAVPIELIWAAMRAFNCSINLCLHYYSLLTFHYLPYAVTFKSQQDCSTINLSSGHGGKTSFLLILIVCSGVLTTLYLLKQFFHTI
jgi:hypothetical protein